MDEIWRAIPGFPGYEASDLGQVRSFKRHALRVLRPSSDKYRGVTLMRDGQRHRRRVAQLVLLAFRGLPPLGMEVCHNDGDSFNDCLCNLRYDTHVSNMRDAVEQGRMLGSRALADSQVYAIRVRYGEGGVSADELAEEYGIQVRRLLLGRTYRDVGGPVVQSLLRLHNDEICQIRRLAADGILQVAIARRYGITESAVSRIVRGNRRASVI